MRLLNHHKWQEQPGFKTWRCSKCGAVRYWDNILQRIVFVKYGKQLYMTPPCNSAINNDPIYKEYSLINSK